MSEATNERSFEDMMALVRPIWDLLAQIWGITGDQDGWHVLYELLDEYPDLAPAAITPDLVCEGLVRDAPYAAELIRATFAEWKSDE